MRWLAPGAHRVADEAMGLEGQGDCVVIWKMAWKDLLLNVMTFKFAAGAIVCVVLTAVLVLVLMSDYRTRLEAYSTNVATVQMELRQSKVYGNILSTRVYRPPSPLSVFSRGIESQVGDSARIGSFSVPEIEGGSVAGNPYLAIFRHLDLSLLHQIVLSLLALLIACDAVSSERAAGTLKLTTSGMVPRYRILLGKLLAGLTTLAVPLTIAFLLAILMLSASPSVDLSASDWARLGLMYVATLLFIWAVYSGGIFISCATRHPTTSLMLGLFFWVVVAMVLPNAGGYLAAQFRPLERPEPIRAQLSALEEEYFFKGTGAADQIKLTGHGVQHEETGLRRYDLVCDANRIEQLAKREGIMQPYWDEYSDKSWQIERRYVETLYAQERLAAHFSRISPVCAYENVMAALAGTDVARCQDFVDRARAHRRDIIEYIRAKTDNYTSPLHFTPSTEADRAEYQQYLDGRMTDEEFEQWKKKKIAQVRPLNLDDFPRFVCRSGLLPDLRRTLLDVSVLVFAGALFFALSFAAFMKYDVR